MKTNMTKMVLVNNDNLYAFKSWAIIPRQPIAAGLFISSTNTLSIFYQLLSLPALLTQIVANEEIIAAIDDIIATID